MLKPLQAMPKKTAAKAADVESHVYVPSKGGKFAKKGTC